MQTHKDSNGHFPAFWSFRNACHGSRLGWHRNNSDAIWMPFIYDSRCVYQWQVRYVQPVICQGVWQKCVWPRLKDLYIENFCLNCLLSNQREIRVTYEIFLVHRDSDRKLASYITKCTYKWSIVIIKPDFRPSLNIREFRCYQ